MAPLTSSDIMRDLLQDDAVSDTPDFQDQDQTIISSSNIMRDLLSDTPQTLAEEPPDTTISTETEEPVTSQNIMRDLLLSDKETVDQTIPEGTIDITTPPAFQQTFTTEELLEPPSFVPMTDEAIAEKYDLPIDHPILQEMLAYRNISARQLAPKKDEFAYLKKEVPFASREIPAPLTKAERELQKAYERVGTPVPENLIRKGRTVRIPFTADDLSAEEAEEMVKQFKETSGGPQTYEDYIQTVDPISAEEQRVKALEAREDIFAPWQETVFAPWKGFATEFSPIEAVKALPDFYSRGILSAISDFFETDSILNRLTPMEWASATIGSVGNLIHNVFGEDGLLRNGDWIYEGMEPGTRWDPEEMEKSILNPEWLAQYEFDNRFDAPLPDLIGQGDFPSPDGDISKEEAGQRYFTAARKQLEYSINRPMGVLESLAVAANTFTVMGRGVRQSIYGEYEVDTGSVVLNFINNTITDPAMLLGPARALKLTASGAILLSKVGLNTLRTARAAHHVLGKTMGKIKAADLSSMSLPNMLKQIQKLYGSKAAIRFKAKIKAIADLTDDGIYLPHELVNKGKSIYLSHFDEAGSAAATKFAGEVADPERLRRVGIAAALKRNWSPQELSEAFYSFSRNNIDEVSKLRRIEDGLSEAFRRKEFSEHDLLNTGFHVVGKAGVPTIESIVGKVTFEFAAGVGPKRGVQGLQAYAGSPVPILEKPAAKMGALRTAWMQIANYVLPFKHTSALMAQGIPAARRIPLIINDAIRSINHQVYQAKIGMKNIMRVQKSDGTMRYMNRIEENEFIVAHELHGDKLLNGKFLQQNNYPPQFAKIHKDLTKYYYDWATYAKEMGHDVSKWKIAPDKYFPHIFAGEYKFVRLIKTGTDKKGKVILEEKLIQDGIGTRDEMIDYAIKYMKDPANLNKEGKFTQDIFIEARNMNMGIADLSDEMLKTIKVADVGKILGELGGIAELRTPLERKKFFQLAQKLQKETRLSKDDIFKIMNKQFDLPSQGRGLTTIKNFKERRADFQNYITDPHVAAQIYTKAIIRRRVQNEKLNPLYELLNTEGFRLNTAAKSIMKERIDWAIGKFNPEAFEGLAGANTILRFWRGGQAARKLWRPSSVLANALGPFQFALAEIPLRYLLRAGSFRKTKAGVKLLNEIQASGAVTWADTGTGFFREAFSGAVRDVKDMKLFQGTTNSLLAAFGHVEARNRAVVPLAAYQYAKEVLKLSHKAAIRLARDADDSFNFMYHMGDLPKAILMFPTLGQFRGFQLNAVYQYGRILGNAIRSAIPRPLGRGVEAIAKELPLARQIWTPLTKDLGAIPIRSKSRYGTNYVHRAFRLMGAQMILGGVRSMPMALRYGTMAAWITSIWSDQQMAENVKTSIDDFIIENPMARGIFAYVSEELSKKTRGFIPAIDLSARVGVIGDNLIPSDLQELLGVNGKDLYSLIQFFARGEEPLQLAGAKLAASEPFLRDFMTVIRGLRDNGAVYDFADRDRLLWTATVSELWAMAFSFPPLALNIQRDKMYVEEVNEQRRREIKRDLIDTIILEREKSSPDTTVIDEAQYKARAILGTTIKGAELSRERIAKRTEPIKRRIKTAPPVLRKEYKGYQRRMRERFGKR